MKELDAAKKVLSIAKDLVAGVDTSRQEILEKAGRARAVQIRDQLDDRKDSDFFKKLPSRESELHANIIAALDQMSRRMPLPLPAGETDHVEQMLDELDDIRSSKEKLPISPGITIWRGAVCLRKHDFGLAVSHFENAAELLRPMIGGSPSVPATLVGALCEAAYGRSMQSDLHAAVTYSDEAIAVARNHKVEEALMSRILREYFIAGDAVTLPLATAYLTACDVRVNASSEWDSESQVANDFNVYWNLLNDECGGLSALEVPYLIAVLSDKNWMTQRPDLAAPIARALYLKTANSVPHALWRKANLFFGGFRFASGVRNAAASNSTKIASAILLAALVGYGGSEAIAASITDVASLPPSDIASYFGTDTSDTPSGAEIVDTLGIEGSTDIDMKSISDLLAMEMSQADMTAFDFEIATGSSSLVGSDLV